MRSIGILLANITIPQVEAWLNQFGSKAYYDNQWCYLTEQGEVALYMWLHDDFANDFDEGDLKQVSRRLASKPSVWIHVDVSGRVDGTREVNQFVTAALKTFNGLAYDEYTNHWWTLVEIENNKKFEHRHFFDFNTSSSFIVRWQQKWRLFWFKQMR